MRPGPATTTTAAPLPAYDGWELDQQLKHIQHLLRSSHAKPSEPAGDGPSIPRVDPAHANVAPWHTPPGLAAPDRETPPAGRRSTLARLTWTALALGTLTFLGGGVLMGWSIVARRPELWNVGMPVVLYGQIVLLVGLVLQLDRMWLANRHTEEKLDQVDRQLVRLKTTTAQLGMGQYAPGSAFYCHFADGANPQLLLADLKSQLDLLAERIGQAN